LKNGASTQPAATKTTALLFVFTFLGILGLHAQVYSFGTTLSYGAGITSCNGTFKDSKQTGPYNNNENYVVSFHPGAAGRAIQLEFDSLSLGTGDTLRIYDGPSTAAALITYFIINDPVTTVRATTGNASGSLTCRFTSDANGTGDGWSANISCHNPCQPFNAALISFSPATYANGYVHICKGQEISITGKGEYPFNNTRYNQADTISTFHWRMSDGMDTSGRNLSQVKHRVNTEGGYIAELRITDSNGCVNTNRASVKVRTGIKPMFNVQLPTTTNCTNDTILIRSNPRMRSGNFTTPPIIADSIFLPDGYGVSYQTSINISQFAPGQKLTQLSDLQGILLNMEHSWLGDLEIAITAPNGVRVRLKYMTGTSGGWESYLGEPVDEPSAASPLAKIAGKGYDYIFSPNATYGKMAAERGQ